MSRLRTTLSRLWQTQQRMSWREIARTLLDRLGEKFWGLQVHEILWLEAGSISDSTPHDPRDEFRFLTPSEIRAFANDPANDLDPAMAERAEGGRDLCFAVLSGGRLANYSWYALDSIEPEHFCGVPLTYPVDTAYHYKGFTHPDFRGQRLHGAAISLGLRELAARFGVTRLISCVHWLNAPSLRSSERLGFQCLGRMLTTHRGRVRLLHAPQAAKALGVRFGAQVCESSSTLAHL